MCGPSLLPRVPSGEEMVEDRGVPVQDDWSMPPDDDRVRFSLSGVTPHSWGKGGGRVRHTGGWVKGQGAWGDGEGERGPWEGLRPTLARHQ